MALSDEVVLRREHALRLMTRSALDNALRRGALVRIFPRVYVTADHVHKPSVRWRAALSYAGPTAVLSHTTALSVWGLLEPGSPVHLMVPGDRRLRPGRGLVVHRRVGFDRETQAVVRAALPVTRLESSIVDSWPSLPERSRRAVVIRAVGERMTTPARLRRSTIGVPNLPGRASLLALLHLLDSGCRSELELWGYAHIFRGEGMPRFRWQHPVSIGTRTLYLDVYAESERVDFELDGAAWHGSPAQRERDLRRDATLAARGILVVRFTHRRLTAEPDAVRQEILAILQSRRGGTY